MKKAKVVTDEIEDDSGAGRRYRAPALEKGLEILELLAGEASPMPIAAIDALFVACAHSQPQRSLAALQQKDEDSRSRWYSPLPESSRPRAKSRKSARQNDGNRPANSHGESG